ncbi:glucose 1-dehydrogenase [Roseomonas terrae]|jgi:glucose 1-dehydrogenase|uniref:Glucose 1-dehydrogenase n=1 Tax=Neoroseomonas terrae TaxID=424799 RepID=A0ABS5EG40_9PROT|nr:glucose 1-dehydrogenase [Neoroseomonas terrae]MBR0649940.1 glucose 1-dehydrogenase [Neoroseomonas terrae]
MASDWLGLTGRVALVTGAAGGIGGAVAAELAAAGAKVALLDRDSDGAAKAAEALRSTGATVFAAGCDTTDQASVAAAFAAARDAIGPATILVNNAGILRPGPLAEIDIDAWNALLAVNLTGYLICAQAARPQMLKAGGGAIVHIASIAATNPQPRSGAYSPSKAGVAMLSRQLALEWGPEGVRSNVVSPGMIRTPLSESFYQAPGILERRSAMVPNRRVGTPQDIADAVTYLASPRAAYVNGAALLVDGGLDQVVMELTPRPGY